MIEAEAACEGGIARIELIYKGVIVQKQDGAVANFDVEETGWYKVRDVEKMLGERFFKCHSYLIVNKDKIKEVCKNEVLFDSGHSIGMCYAAALRLRKSLLNI